MGRLGLRRRSRSGRGEVVSWRMSGIGEVGGGLRSKRVVTEDGWLVLWAMVPLVVG